MSPNGECFPQHRNWKRERGVSAAHQGSPLTTSCCGRRCWRWAALPPCWPRQPGLRGTKHIGVPSTAPAMEVKFRGGGWIWPQTCPWCSRTAAWGWGQALPPCSHQLSQRLLWKTRGCTDSCFQPLLWTWAGGSPATPTVELVFYSHGELASLELWQKEERKKKNQNNKGVEGLFLHQLKWLK